MESIRRGKVLQSRNRGRNLAAALLIQGLVLGISLIFYFLSMSGAVWTAIQEDTKGGIVSSLLIYSNWVDVAWWQAL